MKFRILIVDDETNIRQGLGKAMEMEGHPRVALQSLLPGNIRELRNCVESAVALCKSETISPEDLPPTIAAASGASQLKIPLGLNLAEAEKRYFLGVLNILRDNKTRAAQTLGVSRKTLRRKLNEYKQAEK